MGIRRTLLSLFAILLVALPATVARGGTVETKVLDLRTRGAPGSYTIVFCTARGPVDHAVVLLAQQAPRTEEPTMRAFGLVPRPGVLGVPTAYVGPVEADVVERMLRGGLPQAALGLVCQVDPVVFERASAVEMRWRAKAAEGLTTRDCVAFLREMGQATGLAVTARTDFTPGDLITALVDDNDQTDVGRTPAPAAGPAAPPADLALPRVATLGALPPAEETLVVDVTSVGDVFLDGQGPLTLQALGEAFARRTADPAWREPDRSSRWNLLIRADERVPWMLPVWILQVGANPKVGLYKAAFAARPRDGDGIGALGCELPKDRGIQATAQIVEEIARLSAKIFMNDAPESDPEALYPILRRWREVGGEGLKFEVKTPPPKGRGVPTGYVVRVLDVALRAGFREVVLEGAMMPTPEEAASATWLRDIVAALKQQPGTPTIKIGNETVGRLPEGADVGPVEGLLPTAWGFGTKPKEGPVIRDQEIEDHVETDNDLPYEEELGEGISDAPFEGPSDNGLIGLGGGAGGAFQGRGGVGAAAAPARTPETAYDEALHWLAAHQSPNGGWEAATFMGWCDSMPVREGPDGVGKAIYDPGVTGLALCAFLAGGYTNRGRHEYAKVVSKGLRYLKNVQDVEGCFGPRTSQHYIYNHATAALAMVEAYGMTDSPIFKGSAQRALDFIAICRNPYFAWRYGVKPGDNDTSVTGWMALVLRVAKLVNQDAIKRGKPAPLTIDEDAFEGIRAWLDKMTDPAWGRVGYIQRGGQPARPQELIDKFPGERSESMTAVGVFTRILLGEDPRRTPVIQKGAKLIANLPPVWNPTSGDIDMYYWYYGALAMYQMGDVHWRPWRAKLVEALLEHQRQDTTWCMYRGSWDPMGPWAPDGGRVYATALMALCLATDHRYDRVFGP